MGCAKYKEIQRLQDKLEKLTADPRVEHELINIEFGKMDRQFAINKARREGMEAGRAEGEARGRAEGEAKGRAESEETMARKLLKMKMPIEQIAEVTGLSIEEIARLKVKK